MRPISLLALLALCAGAAADLKPSADLDHPAHRIAKNNVVIDFKGATWEGTSMTTEPDQRKGLGILITGNNVTLKNLKIRGYKIAIMAKNCSGLKLENVDVSYNWKQKLGSDIEKEDLGDWMSFHKNDKNEWHRYGAGIYLDGVQKFEVKGCRATGGQCALMMTRSTNGLVWNNDFSFMSGLGLGMYRSSNNRIMHNRFDFCVRGYSHGVYNRGQDSSGILIYEQSHKNVFAYNSATHGGDGFFLWAGQETMDTGRGGCNDNLVYGNDFSDSPANGIETTFSRNNFINNLCDRCWHAVWGGYSYESRFEGNHFTGNDEAFAIEHGQDNVIRDNYMSGNKLDLNLWANKVEDPNWGYPKHRDTASRDYTITGNIFGATSILKDTARIKFTGNTLLSFTELLAFKSLENSSALTITGNTFYAKKQDLPDGQTDRNTWMGPATQVMVPTWTPAVKHPFTNFGGLGKVNSDWAQLEPKPLTGGKSFFYSPTVSDTDAKRGRQYMLVDQWGPNDYRYPRIWPKPVYFLPNKMAGEQMEVVGPKGKWKIVSLSNNIQVMPREGTVPGSFHVQGTARFVGNVKIEMEYVGAEATDYRGINTPAGKPIRFTYERFKLPIEWTVKWYGWDKDKSDPRTQKAAFDAILAGEPLATEKMMELNRDWYGKPNPKVTDNHFASVAEGLLDAPAGDYDLEVTMDDGARVWLDGKLLIDEWHYQGPTTYSKRVKLGGKHKINIQHFEIDGFSCLKVKLKPVKK